MIKGLEARNLDRGRVARLSFSGAESTFRNDSGEGKLTLNALTMDGVDVSHFAAAAESGKLLDGLIKIDRIAFEGFEGAIPDPNTSKDAPGGNLNMVKLGSMSLEANYAGDIPTKLSMAVRGFAMQPAPTSALAKDLKEAGLAQLELGVTFGGSYDAAAKTYAVDDLTLSMGQLGSVGLKAEFAGVDGALFAGDSAQRTAAAASLAFSGLTLRVVNNGGVEKALTAAGTQQGKTPEALKTEIAGAAAQFIPALLGGTPAAQSTGAAVAAFVNNPKSLTVAVKAKAGPLPFVEAMAAGDPMAIIPKLAISAASEGAPAAPSATGQTASAAPPAGETRKLKGLAALNALIGNTISGKTPDGDSGAWFYDRKGAVKQLVEDDVTTGKWAIRGEKLCEEYPDDDEETCYTVEVAGTVVTFTDDDGSGRRYELVSGNAKKL